jgi:hypothetical protein
VINLIVEMNLVGNDRENFCLQNWLFRFFEDDLVTLKDFQGRFYNSRK